MLAHSKFPWDMNSQENPVGNREEEKRQARLLEAKCLIYWRAGQLQKSVEGGVDSICCTFPVDGRKPQDARDAGLCEDRDIWSICRHMSEF